MSKNTRELWVAIELLLLTVLMIGFGVWNLHLRWENDKLRDSVIRAEQRAAAAEKVTHELVAAGVRL